MTGADEKDELTCGRGSPASDGPSRLEGAGRTAAKVAASAVIASSLATALAEPPHAEALTLPEPVPIVRQYQAFDEDVLPGDEDEQDEGTSRWRRVLRALRYLLLALAVTAALLFGALRGCTGVAGGLLLPPATDDERQEQPAPTSHAEDERGVALAT